jgi:hypothetical protein
VQKRLLDDLRAWHQVIDARLQRRADDPTQYIEPSADVRKRLADRLARLEASIEEIFTRSDDGELSAESVPVAGQLPGPVGGRDRLCATGRRDKLGAVARSKVLKEKFQITIFNDQNMFGTLLF